MCNGYISIYADFDCKISHVMFLHDYPLTCEISTVRTLALKEKYTQFRLAVNKKN